MQVESAHGGVHETLRLTGLETHLMGRPQGAELRAPLEQGVGERCGTRLTAAATGEFAQP